MTIHKLIMFYFVKLQYQSQYQDYELTLLSPYHNNNNKNYLNDNCAQSKYQGTIIMLTLVNTGFSPRDNSHIALTKTKGFNGV